MIPANRMAWFLRALVAGALVSTFVWLFWFQKGIIGYSSRTANGITHVAAGSNPAAVFLSVLGIVFYGALTREQVRVGDWQVASLQLRLGAFLFDLWFLLFCISGIGSILTLLLEANRTGNFQWHFESRF